MYNIFSMTTENLTEQMREQIISAVLDAHNCADLSNLVEFLTESYADAQLSPLCGSTPEVRYNNFYNFKNLYNLLKKLEMQLDPDITEINILV